MYDFRPPSNNPLERLTDLSRSTAFVVGGLAIVPILTILGLARGLRLLNDPGAGAGATAAGTLMMIGVATVPALGLLTVSRRRADLEWWPAVTTRDQTPWRPGPADLVLTQTPGRWVAGILATWLATIASVVLALGLHRAWWLAVAAGLTVIARLTWRLRTRPVLAISADGFEVSSGRRRIALAWQECAAFTATPQGRVQVTVAAGSGLRPPPPNAIRAGLDHRSADDLARLLSSYLPGT